MPATATLVERSNYYWLVADRLYISLLSLSVLIYEIVSQNDLVLAQILTIDVLINIPDVQYM